MSKGLYFICTLLMLFISLFDTHSQQVPFNRGINLTNWFQAANAQQIQASKYTFQDFQQIQSLGCDVIRLPINLHAMTSGSPNYQLDPLFLEFLDQAVDWAETLGIYLILDNHTFDPAVGTDPNIGSILETVWTQMADHYKDRSEYLMYEVLNEPHDISDQQWNTIQMGVVDAIRVVDQEHYIVIGPAGWNSFHNLDKMPVYTQDKLIYTFHFYDPFVFTHQGASWTSPSMAPLAGVPFPHDVSNMPAFPSSLVGSWIESAFNNYQNEGTTTNLQSMIDIALQFRDERDVLIFCGEFGAYIPNSNNDDRVFYYQQLQQYLEGNNIPWTMWDYHGGFGLYEEGGYGLFDHDLNVPLLEALEMNVPPQTSFVKQPETNGFPIYTDQIANPFLESSSGDSKISYYSQDSPNNGKYCIRWEDGQQYQYIGLNVNPTLDLTVLESQGYALDLLFRGSEPVSFDIRFLDSDMGIDDRPWRMRYTIDKNIVDFNSRWHHLHIPLSDFTEGGAWEGEWYPPEGKFDWTEIDELQIIAEHEDMGNARFWFDNMYITNMDTAQVQDDSVFEDLVTSVDENELSRTLYVYPNPAKNLLSIGCRKINSNGNSNLVSYYQLIDGYGRIIQSSVIRQNRQIDISTLPAGPYLLRVYGQNGVLTTTKLLKL